MSFKPIKYRAHNGYDTDEASNAAAIPADQHGESMTVQSQAEDADINVMLKRFGVLGQMPTSIRIPEYGDFTGVGDFRSALHAAMDAQEQFMKLPPKLRAQMNNDPQEFLEWVQDPANVDELVKLGLAVAKPKENVNGAGSGSNVGGADQAAGGGAVRESAAAPAGKGAGAAAGG